MATVAVHEHGRVELRAFNKICASVKMCAEISSSGIEDSTAHVREIALLVEEVGAAGPCPDLATRGAIQHMLYTETSQRVQVFCMVPVTQV